MLSSARTTRSTARPARDPRAFVVDSLAAKAQSVAEIEAKLVARAVEAQTAASLVAEAKRLGYLDDEELARQLARGHRARGYGRRRAAQTLRRRGLPDPLAEAALEDAYGTVDEVELAVRALGSRVVDDANGRRRATAFLVRRGFSFSTARRAVRRLEPP